LGHRKSPCPSFLLGSGTWKNSKLFLYIGSGTIPRPSRGGGVTLLSPPYKLQALPVNSQQ